MVLLKYGLDFWEMRLGSMIKDTPQKPFTVM